jgi:hypothetical protein
MDYDNARAQVRQLAALASVKEGLSDEQADAATATAIELVGNVLVDVAENLGRLAAVAYEFLDRYRARRAPPPPPPPPPPRDPTHASA